MTRLLTAAGRTLFGLALIGFGLCQFVVWDFVPGRAPAFVAAPMVRALWVSVTGVLFVVAGLAIVTGKRAIRFALGTAALIAVWALLRHLPLVAADRSIGVEWTNTGKALALTGGALALAGSFLDRRSGFLLAMGRWCLGAFMILAGIQHFLFAAFVQQLVPAWVPARLFWTYFAGVSLIAGGIGMQVPRTRRLAAVLSGVMVFLWVFMLHIPRALAAPPDQRRNEWTAVFEAVAVSGIAFTAAGSAAQKRDLGVS